MKIIKGNLINIARAGEIDVLVHGCNCFNTMGAGIAKQIRKVFPEAYYADQKTGRGDKRKLGRFSFAKVMVSDKQIHIVNAYTQYRYDLRVPQIDEGALRNCFDAIKQQYNGKVIAYPKIGAGLAGGDWNRISAIIDECLAGEDHFCVSLTGD